MTWGAIGAATIGVVGGAMLGDKGSTQSQAGSSEPWWQQQPYLKGGFEKAQTLLNAPAGSTVSPFTPSQQSGISLGQDYAKNFPSFMAPVSSAFSGTLDPSVATNKYLPGLVSATINPVQDKLFNEWLPQINSAFINSGQATGSPQYIKGISPLLSQATRDITDATSRLGANIYGQNLDAMTKSLALSPAIAELGLSPSNVMLALGGLEQGQAQRGLDEPWANLQRYMQAIQGSYGGQTTGSFYDPSQALKGAIGGGLLGYNLYKGYGGGGGGGGGASPYDSPGSAYWDTGTGSGGYSWAPD